MRKKGFTLIELVGVIIIIGILAAVITAVVTKNIYESRQKVALEQENTIIDASKSYLIDNPDSIDNGECFVTVGILRDMGYLDDDLINPLTQKRYKSKTCVSYIDSAYSVTYVNEKGPNTEGEVKETEEHEVIYDCVTNGGTCPSSTSNYNAIEDEAIDLSAKAVKKGWKFIGWNTNKYAKSALKKKYMGKKDITLYAIYKKEAIKLSADFEVQNSDSAYASSDKATCNIKAVYNNEKQGSTCQATVPTLTAKAGSEVIGWNTDKTSHDAILVSGDALTLSAHETSPRYYSITNYNPKKATFYVMDNNALNNETESRTCTIYNIETECKIEVPSIVAKDGYTAYGWNTDSSATTGTYKGEEILTFERNTNNKTFFSITRWDTPLKAIFNGNNSTIKGDSSAECYLYNGKIDCNVSAPEVEPNKDTPTFVGWNLDSNGKTNDNNFNTKTNVLKLNRNNMGKDWYAITKKAITIKATFEPNGTKINKQTKSCNLTLYNGALEDDLKISERGCTVETPTIDKSILPDNYDTFIGFNIDSNAKENINHVENKSYYENGTLYLSLVDDEKVKCDKNRTECTSVWYPITKKEAVTLSATFNGNNSIIGNIEVNSCILKEVYNGKKQDKTCNISTPEVTNTPSTTPDFIGWNMNKDGKTNDDSYDDGILTLNESNTGHTWYVITKGESETLEAEFVIQDKTGLSGNSGTMKCIIDAPYNGNIRGDRCTLNTPILESKNESYTFVGWNENKKAKESSVSDIITLYSGNKKPTFYSISYKTLTATFNSNGSNIEGVDESGSVQKECYAYNGDDSCDVDVPSITRDNFNILGYSTNKDDKDKEKNTFIKDNKLTLKSNINLYAITYRDITISFITDKNKVSKLDDSNTSLDKECTIWNINNTCKIITPSITPNDSYSDNTTWKFNFKRENSEEEVDSKKEIEVNNNDIYNVNVKDIKEPSVSFNPSGYKYNVKWFNSDTLNIKVAISDDGIGLKNKQELCYLFSTKSKYIDEKETEENPWTCEKYNINDDGTFTINIKPTRYIINTSGRYFLWIKGGISDKQDNKTEDIRSDKEYDYDNIIPIIKNVGTNATTNSVTVTANASATSGIDKYEYSLDGINFVEDINSHTFNDLISGTTYDLYVRATSKSGLTSEITKTEFKTDVLGEISFSKRSDDGTVTINYPSGCGTSLKCTYEKDNEGTVEVKSSYVDVTFDSYGTLKAEATDEFNNISTRNSMKVTLPINDATASISSDEYTYDGTEKKPTVSVKYNGNELSSDMYSIYYLDKNSYDKFISGGSLTDIKSISPIDAGTYYVVIAGNNNYDGYIKKELSFVINKKEGYINLSKTKETVDKETLKINIEINDSSGKISLKTDNKNVNASISDNIITVNGLENIDYGKSVNIEIISAESTNYKAATITYVITKEKIDNNISINSTEVSYTGEKQEVTASSTNGEAVTLKYYSDDKCTKEEAPINVGTYYATGTTSETDTYKKGELKCTKAITISKAKPNIELPDSSSLLVGESLNINIESNTTGTYSLNTKGDNVFAYIRDNTLSITGKSIGESTIEIKFNPNDDSNYESTTIEYQIKINAKEITINFEKGSGTASIGEVINNTCTFTSTFDTCTIDTPSIKPKTGYNAIGFSSKNDDSSDNLSLNSITVSANSPKTYYAISAPNIYTINYNLNGGVNGSSAPTSAKYGSVIKIDNPSKTFVINIDDDGNTTSVSGEQTFTGWTGSNILDGALSSNNETLTDKWDGNKTTNMYFKNLRNDNESIYLTANWESNDIKLPEITKDGYTCSYKDDNNKVYAPLSNYTPSTNEGSVTLHTYCVANEVSIAIYKDDELWTSNDVSLALYKDGKKVYNLTNSDGYAKASSIKSGTYDIYASLPTNSNLVDTKEDIVVSSTGSAKIHYYSLELNSGSHIESTSGSGIYLKGYSLNIESFVEEGFSFGLWQVETGSYVEEPFSSSTSITVNNATILTALSSDGAKPLCTIISSNDLKSDSQTVTLMCKDSENITGYYFGESQNDIEDSQYININKKEFTLNKNISKGGTYYLYAKNSKGNVSDGTSITMYKYTVENILNESIYKEDDYIAPSGTEIDISKVYTEVGSGTYSYYTIENSDNIYDDKYILTSDVVLKVWFK